jgi:ABC-type multidrug transport system permease subunit
MPDGSPPQPAPQQRAQPTKAAQRYSPLLELTKARIREFYREPGAVFWVFGFPVIMLVALGLAFRNAPPPEPRVVVQNDVEAWVSQALETESFDVTRSDARQAEATLGRGAADVLIAPDAQGGLRFAFDAARSEARLAHALVNDALQRAQGRQDAFASQVVEVSKPGSRYVDYLLPGLIGLNLMSSSMWGIGYSVVLARKRRLLRRFAASPLRRSHFLGAYALSRLVFLAAELVALLIFGALAFGVSIKGSLLAFCAVSLIGSTSFAGLSLLIAARLESVETANGWLNFLMLPMWLLSGTFFSYERFPDAIQPLIQALPLTALNDALRAISSDGAGLISTWPQLAVLSVWGIAGFALALRFFRWQ